MNADQRSITRRVAAVLVGAATCGALLVSPLTTRSAAARDHDTSQTITRTGTAEAAGETKDAGGFRHPCAAAKTRCDGEMTVPLDWNDPASERITVAFAWLPRKNAGRPSAGTVLANPGGPLPALPAVPSLTEALGPVLDRHDLLVVEPRGLGKSSPLLCPGLDLERRETVSACVAHLGPRARFFTADQAVTDMNAVREALGVPKVTFYGISYGTVFAQAYATRHPDGLSGVLLDSIVLTGEDGYVTTPIRSRADLLDVACDPSRACRRLPGDPSGLLSGLVRHLRAHPDPQLRLSSLMNLTHSLYLPMVGREASAAVAAYLNGDRLPLRRLTRMIDEAPRQPLRAPELAGLLSYVCADTAFPFERTAPADERRRRLNRYYDRERPFRPFAVTDLAAPPPASSILGMQDVCADRPAPRVSPPVPPGAKHPRVPTLALGGDFDSTTPAEAAAVTRRFPGSTFSRVRFAGHNLTTGALVNECVRDAMRAFLTDPDAFDDKPRCDDANYRAVGSFPETVARVPQARGTDLPARDRRVLAAAFATVADATARRDPLRTPPWAPATQAGLRGGALTFDDKAATVDLRDVRFVGDLTVNGEVRLSGGDATARLTVTGGGGGSRALDLSWKPFRAEDDTAVSGTFAGHGFTATIPSH
ncbi:alpha/beta fold hydrolase [Streptosporangium sp. NPDC000509]|uniref:alpha/beta fold hydrolase n=1 Tax=Streptosporangium sp. NPDC000509 TaxID=3366186 RepID=UPI0036AD6E08